MGAVYLAYPRLASHGCLSPSGLALASSLIMRQHLARYLLRSPGNDRLNGVIAHVFTGDVIDGPEPPPVMLDFQAHFGASVFRCPAPFPHSTPFCSSFHMLSSLHPAQLAGLLFVHGHPGMWTYSSRIDAHGIMADADPCPSDRSSRSDPLSQLSSALLAPEACRCTQATDRIAGPPCTDSMRPICSAWHLKARKLARDFTELPTKGCRCARSQASFLHVVASTKPGGLDGGDDGGGAAALAAVQQPVVARVSSAGASNCHDCPRSGGLILQIPCSPSSGTGVRGCCRSLSFG